MITLKTTVGEDCYIDESKVIGVLPCLEGSRVLLEGGSEVVVKNEPREIMAAIEGKIKWVDMKINPYKVTGVSLCCQGSKIHFDNGSTVVVRGSPPEVWQKLGEASTRSKR